jgi:hypothetical protein|tara:strand:+ start:32 stop:427 length:396 start_codon:yes stop_codon:yes gene_type:complete
MPMNRIKIQVKEKHIKDGSPENCTYCAVALAVSDKLSSMFKLDLESRIVEKGNTDYALDLATNKPFPYQLKFDTQINMQDQETLNDFVYDFDNGKEVNPFEFDIEISSYVIERMRKLEKEERTILDVKNKK